MKFINKKILFAVTALFIVALMPFIQSCSNNNELEDTEKIQSNVELTASEKNEIISSTEFKNYVKASAELASEFQKLELALQDSNLLKSAKKGVTPSGDFITFPFIIDKGLIKQVELTTASLLEKHPIFQSLTKNSMKALMNEALLNKSIYKTFSEKRLFKMKEKNTRRKTLVAEGQNLMVYDNVEEAYCFASNYAMCEKKEACGYRLANGLIVVYLKPTATDTSSSYPVYQRHTTNGVLTGIMWSGYEIVGAFQTHLYNATPSTIDDTAHSGDFKNTSVTILYGGGAYIYNYQNGVNMGLVYE